MQNLSLTTYSRGSGDHLSAHGTACFTSYPRKRGWRACDNYHKLNAQMVPDRYPIAQHDFVDRLNENTIFTTLDLVQDYNQIPIT
jgi:hypothetical protein